MLLGLSGLLRLLLGVLRYYCCGRWGLDNEEGLCDGFVGCFLGLLGSGMLNITGWGDEGFCIHGADEYAGSLMVLTV